MHNQLYRSLIWRSSWYQKLSGKQAVKTYRVKDQEPMPPAKEMPAGEGDNPAKMNAKNRKDTKQ
jgi:hypothetical protein